MMRVDARGSLRGIRNSSGTPTPTVFERLQGLHVAQVLLGHKHAQATETYAPAELDEFDGHATKLIRKHG